MLCLPGYLVLIPVIISILCTCLLCVSNIFASLLNGNSIVGTVIGNISQLLSQFCCALLCILLVSIFCASETGRIVLWILVLINIVCCISTVTVNVGTIYYT